VRVAARGQDGWPRGLVGREPGPVAMAAGGTLAPGAWLVLVPPSLPPLVYAGQSGVMGDFQRAAGQRHLPPTPGSEPIPSPGCWPGEETVGPQALPALAPGGRGCSTVFWRRVLGGSPSHRRSGDGHPRVLSLLLRLGSGHQATASTEMETLVQGACWGHPLGWDLVSRSQGQAGCGGPSLVPWQDPGLDDDALTPGKSLQSPSGVGEIPSLRGAEAALSCRKPLLSPLGLTICPPALH